MIAEIPQRPPPATAFQFFERGWRVALAWMLGALVVLPLCIFVLIVLIAIGVAVIRSAMNGQPVPDMTAGMDRVLAPAWPYIGAAIATLWGLMGFRHREVHAQIVAGGGQDRPPFAPSSPPPSAPVSSPDDVTFGAGSMVNPHGGPAAP